MPQALSINPASETLTPRTPIASNPTSDTGPSKFDNALESARQKGAAQPQDSISSTTDSTSKTAKGKPAKTSRGKTTGKSQAVKAKKKDDATDADGADATDENVDPSANQQLAQTAPAEAEDAEQPTTKTNPKPKAPAHPTDVDVTAQPPQISQTAPQNPAEKMQTEKHDTQSEEDAGVEAVASKPVALEKATQDASQTTQNAASQTAKPEVQTTQQTTATDVATLKLGAPVTRTKSDSEVDPQIAPANDAATAAAAALDALEGDSDAGDGISQTADAAPSATAPKAANRAGARTFADTLQSLQDPAPTKPSGQPLAIGSSTAPQTPREIQFADTNHDRIVSTVHTQLLPNGGSMQIRLDPPELGSLSVSVHMKDGVMTATFETSNDQASRLLTHSLSQLKTALESEGVTVGRLHVQQAPRDSEAGSRQQNGRGGDDNQQSSSQQHQEQQRREMLRRMWRRVNGGKDPLDLVA